MPSRPVSQPLTPLSIARQRPGRVFIEVALALTMAALGACAGQGEGQLCNPKAGNSGNDDCQSGLTCQSRPAVVMSPYGICCPPNGQSTTTACSLNGTSVSDASPAPPPDASGPEAGDAAPGESPSEADASADAPGETDASEGAASEDASDAAAE